MAARYTPAEFLAQIVLPDNTTVGQWAATAIPAAYATGEMPRGMLALPPARTEDQP